MPQFRALASEDGKKRKDRRTDSTNDQIGQRIDQSDIQIAIHRIGLSVSVIDHRFRDAVDDHGFGVTSCQKVGADRVNVRILHHIKAKEDGACIFKQLPDNSDRQAEANGKDHAAPKPSCGIGMPKKALRKGKAEAGKDDARQAVQERIKKRDRHIYVKARAENTAEGNKQHRSHAHGTKANLTDIFNETDHRDKRDKRQGHTQIAHLPYGDPIHRRAKTCRRIDQCHSNKRPMRYSLPYIPFYTTGIHLYILLYRPIGTSI